MIGFQGGKPGSQNSGHCGVSKPTCPDNSCCGAGETCCQQADGSYGCCPFDEGSCCTDQKHCCPTGYTCNLNDMSCTRGGVSIALARYAKVSQGLCDSGSRACRDGSCCGRDGTCCQLFDGLQGCAPFTDAMCCSDGIHACPGGSTCDTKNGVCVDSASGLIFGIAKLVPSTVPPGVDLVCYPDELKCESGSCCESSSTCCPLNDGFEACCPYTDGVCCGGGMCCPNGYTCENAHEQCVGPEGKATMRPSIVCLLLIHHLTCHPPISLSFPFQTCRKHASQTLLLRRVSHLR